VPYTDDDEERLNYLEQFTAGEPNSIVHSYSYLEGTVVYQSVLRELDERYGDNEIIASSFINKALNWPPVRPNDDKCWMSWRYFCLSMKMLCVVLYL